MTIVTSRPDYAQTHVHVAHLGFGKFNVIRGEVINTEPLTREQAMELKNQAPAIDQLRAEIASVDDKLRKLDEQERDGEQNVTAIALAAHRGDDASEKKLRAWAQEKNDIGVRRHSLQSAKRAIEAEIVEEQRKIAKAQERACAEQAKAIVEKFRARGEAMDTALRAFADHAGALLVEAKELSRLTPAEISRDVVRVNVTLALNTVLSTISYLDTERVPPLSRRTFKQLLDGWALSPEAWCDHVLLGVPLPKAPPKPAPRSAMPEVKALEPTAATMPTRKPKSIHDASDAPLKVHNVAG